MLRLLVTENSYPLPPPLPSSTSSILVQKQKVYLSPDQMKAQNIMSSSSSSPCAACKFLRRKCQPECVFAPYFPPDQPSKFNDIHRVFGASNVAKLVNELHPHQREDAVNSLAYEADMRLRDPVYGCVGVIAILQRQLWQLQVDLSFAKFELSKYQNQGLSGPGHHRLSQTSHGIGLIDGMKDQHNQQQMMTCWETRNSLEGSRSFRCECVSKNGADGSAPATESSCQKGEQGRN